MPSHDLVKSESNGVQEPEKVYPRGENNRKDSHRRFNNTSRDLEAQKLQSSSPPAPFPGATYGLDPSDQPTQPPRRVPSKSSSLHKPRSLTSLRNADPNAPPVPSLPPNSASPIQYQTPDDLPNESLAEELAWNPSHPCFPHPNPHVPLASPLYNSTRIIRVRRDWMAHGDLAPAYSNVYPEILDPLMPESEFRFLLNHINTTLLDAFDPFSAWNWIDGVLGLATGWLWEDFRPGGVKGKLKALEFWIEQWNHRVGSKDGVRVLPLRRTAYMSLDIEIPDPQVRLVDSDDEDEEEDEEEDDDDVGYNRNQMAVDEIGGGVGVRRPNTGSDDDDEDRSRP